MKTDRPINLWILDDDKALCLLLDQQFKKVGWRLTAFHHPQQLPQALCGAEPDILVLDQLLPEKHGLDVLTGLRQGSATFPVLVLSALGAPSDRIAGLEAGADDYLAKPFQFRELQLRIERLLRTLPASSPAPDLPMHQPSAFQLGRVLLETAPRPRLISAQGDCYRLSRGDCALLTAFCVKPGEVLSREHLLKATGSLVTPGKSRTIDVRLSRLRRLLRDLTGSELITPERGLGYKLTVEVKYLDEAATALPQP